MVNGFGESAKKNYIEIQREREMKRRIETKIDSSVGAARSSLNSFNTIERFLLKM